MDITCYLPDELGQRAKDAGLPFSRMLRDAVERSLGVRDEHREGLRVVICGSFRDGIDRVVGPFATDTEAIAEAFSLSGGDYDPIPFDLTPPRGEE